MTLILVALLSLTGCNPPIELNEPPTLQVRSPEDDTRIRQSETFAIRVFVNDADGGPLTLVIADRTGTELARGDDLDPGSEYSFDVTLVEAGEQSLGLTLTDPRDDTAQETLRVVINGRPTDPVLAISPTDPTTSDDLVGDIVTAASDPESGLLIHRWEWRQGTNVLASGTDPDRMGSLPASATTKGTSYTFAVRVQEAISENQPDIEGFEFEVEDSVTVGNEAPGRPAVEVIPGQPTPVTPLQCLIATAAPDADGDTLTYRYDWERNGTSTGIDTAVLPADLTAPGERWTCNAWANDGDADGPTARASVEVLGRLVQIGDISLTYVGDNPNQALGTHAAGISLDDVIGDDLALGIPESSLFGTQYGMVGMFRGGALSGGDIEDRKVAVSGFTRSHLGDGLRPIPSVRGGTDADLLVGLAGSSGTTNPGVLLLFGDSLTQGVVSFPYSNAEDDNVLPGNDAILFSWNNSIGWGADFSGGDVDGDGLAEIFVTDDAGAGTSAVYVYTASDIASATAATATSPRIVASGVVDRITSDRTADGFGQALASGGDVDGDGSDDLIVSARGRTSGAFAWVFTGDDLDAVLGSGTALNPGDASITYRNANVGEAGWQVAILPDIDGDGNDEIALSSPLSVRSGEATGLVALQLGAAGLSGTFDFDATGMDLVIFGEDPGGRFGDRLVAVGDLTRDGRDELAVAAPNEDVDANGDSVRERADAGAVHVFTGANLLSAMSVGSLLSSDAEVSLIGDYAGGHLTLAGPAGDLDLDGTVDLLATSPVYSDTWTNQGILYVFLSGS